jgi:predicted RNase H-like HicB family nuclease
MDRAGYLEYRVNVFRDPETGRVIGEVPTLGIADDGADAADALVSLRAMVVFHLECLAKEREPIPTEEDEGEGVYIRIRPPSRAA